jgi:di/tripeptidase
VAGLLVTAATLCAFPRQPYRDIWFVANVGEEGLGDLHGMRAVAERFDHAAAFIVVEGGLFGRICHQAIGVRRFRIAVETEGGHSWGAFGNPSAIHVLGHIIAGIDRLNVPNKPKTTYNVGVVSGGTTINSIAGEAHLLLDLRSESPPALETLVAQVDEIVQSCRTETGVDVVISSIGNRPAGTISRKHLLVQWATAALNVVGAGKYVEYTTGSTDANVPLSQGRPTVCIGLTQAGNAHRLDEYLDITHIPAGLGQLLLLVLSVADGKNIWT